MIAIAKNPMGLCGCGLQIEPGEQYRTLGVLTVHVGCEDKARSEAAPTLFTLTPDPETKPEQRFEAAYLESSTSTPRLMGQLRRTFELMRDGRAWTLTELASALGCLETSAGARIRDLRKPEHGGHMVLCETRADGSAIREYRLIVDRAGGARSAA